MLYSEKEILNLINKKIKKNKINKIFTSKTLNKVTKKNYALKLSILQSLYTRAGLYGVLIT